MSKLQFQLDFLDGLVKTLQSMAGDHDHMARSLQGRARSAQSVGADGWVVDQVRYAGSILNEHPDRLAQLSRELQARLNIAHSVADEWSGTPTGLRLEITGAMTATAGLLKAATCSAAANKRAQVTDKKAAKSAVLGASTTAGVQGVHGLLKQIPLVRQLETSYTDARLRKVDPDHGGLNCGPTVLTMAVGYFYRKTKTTPGVPLRSKLQVANYVRGGAFTPASDNYYHPLGDGTMTNFGLDNSATGENSRALLGQYGLQINRIDATDGLTSVKKALDDGNPVALLVNNHEYADPGKSAEEMYGGMGGALTRDHVVLVTAYESDSVRIDDPLALHADQRIPFAEFTAAATNTGNDPWYGGVISPAPQSPQPSFDTNPIAGQSGTLKPK